MRRTIAAVVVLGSIAMAPTEAQYVTVGVGVLLSDREPQPVFELHAATPPLHSVRAYATLSWSDDGARPVVITAAEASVLATRVVRTGFGTGLLWLDANDYQPYPILVSSTVVPLPIPRTSIVAIGSTQPFQDWAWSVVLKVGVLAWLRR